MRPSYLAALLLLLAACSHDTSVYQSKFSKKYQNGKSIDVVREDEVTQWTGMITHANYGRTETFTYKFNIEPDDYKWEGLANQAPLALIFCGDDTFLKTTLRTIKYDSLYGEGQVKDTTIYFKNVDKRYFFKLFGEQYFTESDSATYHQVKTKCSEVPVPYLAGIELPL